MANLFLPSAVHSTKICYAFSYMANATLGIKDTEVKETQSDLQGAQCLAK